MKVKLVPASPVIPPPTVTITLSYKEACALMAICGKMSGNANLNVEFIAPLYNALEEQLNHRFLGQPFDGPMRANDGFWEKMPDRP